MAQICWDVAQRHRVCCGRVRISSTLGWLPPRQISGTSQREECAKLMASREGPRSQVSRRFRAQKLSHKHLRKRSTAATVAQRFWRGSLPSFACARRERLGHLASSSGAETSSSRSYRLSSQRRGSSGYHTDLGGETVSAKHVLRYLTGIPRIWGGGGREMRRL